MSDTGEVIYLPEVRVTPDEEIPRESPFYTPGGGKEEPTKDVSTSVPAIEYKVVEAPPAPTKWKYSVQPPPPPEKAAEPVTTSTPPGTKWKYAPQPPPPPDSEKPPESYGTAANVAAGAVEGTVPGVAHAAASPLDVPVNVSRAGVHSLMGIYGNLTSLGKDIGSIFGLTEPDTNEEFLKREKKIAEDVPIPASPGGTYLAGKAGEIGLPTPQTPMSWITPTNEAERIGRRAGQVGGQIATQALASRAYSPFRSYTGPPGGSLVGTPKGLVAGIFEGPRVMGSIPAGQAGAVAGGASAAGQYAAERAKESGASPEAVNLIEKGTNIAASVPLAVGGGVASAVGRVAGVPRLTTIPGQEIASSGIFGPFAAKRAHDQLTARALSQSPVRTLAEEGDWNPSSENIGRTLRGQLTDAEQTAIAARDAEQAAADAAVGKIGGTDASLLSRSNRQQTEMGSELATMRADVPSAGKQIRNGINKLVRRDGVFGRIKAEDPKNKGKPLFPDSLVPGMVFNAKITFEELGAMFNKATKSFRDAYQAIGLDDFIRKTEKLGPDGKPNGQIDLDKAATYLEKNKPLLDNVEAQMEKQWGTKGLEDHGIRSRIGLAIERQKGIDALNSQRDELLKGALRTGGRDATSAEALWGPGAKGGENVREYLRIMSGDADAVHNIVDIAAADLRNFARKPGTTELDHTKANTWLKSHQDALNQLPTDARNGFRDAARLQETVDLHTAARARGIDAFRTGAAKEMLGGTDSVVALQKIFEDTSKSPEIAIKELSDQLRPVPAAHDALKRGFMKIGIERAQQETKRQLGDEKPSIFGAIGDRIRGRHAPAANVDSIKFMENLNNFLRDNQASARELFGDSTVTNMMEMMSKHPGYAKPGSIGSILTGAMVVGELGGYATLNFLKSAFVHHPVAATIVAGTIAVPTAFRALKSAGITKVNDLLPKIMMDPQLVRDLTRPSSDQAAWARVAKQLAIIGTDEEMSKYKKPAKTAP